MLVFGFIPAWIAAVAVSLTGSFLNVSGFLLQKMALRDATADTWPRIGDLVLSPKWILGFLLAVVAPFPGDLIAYALAPLSLTAPLSGFTVVLNTIVAPTCLGERLQPWPDLAAMGLILLGCVLSTLTGAHQEDYSSFTFETMLTFCADPVFLVALVFLIISIVYSMVYMARHANAMEAAAQLRPTNPPMMQLVIPAWTAAGAGCLTNLWLKALGVMFQVRAPFLKDVACLLFGVVPFALLQINYLNRGLKLYYQTIFFPTYSALLVLTNTVYGSIFYKEYKTIMNSTGQITTFCLGVTAVIFGISLFRFRSPAQAADQMEKGPRNVQCSLAASDGASLNDSIINDPAVP